MSENIGYGVWPAPDYPRPPPILAEIAVEMTRQQDLHGGLAPTCWALDEVIYDTLLHDYQAAGYALNAGRMLVLSVPIIKQHRVAP